MAISAYEMKRLGVAKKPLIIAKNANVSSIYKEFKKAYPFSRVLHPSENDFKPKKRRLMFRKMMNNHWDAVIISHDQFKMIPQSLLIQKEILSDELSALQSDLDAVRADEDISPSSYELKGLEKRKNNLNARLEEVKANIKRDDQLMDFETMGFDHLFVDESQEFKNLMYTTRHSRISGLGDPKGSQRAYNLLLACRTIQKNLGNVDKGITFLSGTTISNSLVELYLLFKYLRPNELKRLQIRSFDSWAKVYARKTYEFEFGITNEIKRKERYREFIKVPELARFYTEITDVVNHKNFTQEKPEVENIMTNLPATDDQSKYMDSLVQFAKTKDGSHIGYHNMTKKEQNAYMLIATNLAKKMSLDMRLIDPSYQFAEGSKLDTCSKKLAEIYHNTTSFKGTQLVFCDMSTPSNKWNVYHTLRDLLVIRHNVKPAEIAFIHSVNNGEQKLTLFKRVNDGEIRILIGSTIKMGVGVNVQERVIAMHHLDIPWRPSDMAQRTGRGGRPGNIMAKLHNNNKVWNFVYATEKSLDSYQFNLLHTKQRFIDQIKDNSITARRIDEGSMDSEGGDATMNFAEYVAILSGNQTLLKKVKLDKQIKDLVMQLDGFQAEQRAAERSIRMVNYHTKELEEKIKNQEADFALKLKLEEEPDSIPNMEDRYYYPKPVVLNDVKLYDSRAIGEILLETFRHTNPFILGQYGPFKLLVKKRSLIVYGSNGEEYTSGWGYPTGQPAIAGQYIKRSLNGIKSSLDKLYQERKTYQDSLVSFQRITCKEFGKLDELAKLREESKELEREIEDSVIEESNEQTQTAA
jgi:predicted  nucleic acid-binding Zn-ribbon protein